MPGALNPSNIKNYTVNWGPGITLEQHADYLRLVWVSILLPTRFTKRVNHVDIFCRSAFWIWGGVTFHTIPLIKSHNGSCSFQIRWCDKSNETSTAPGQHYYILFFSGARFARMLPVSRTPYSLEEKKTKTKTEKILWIGCSLTPVKRLWQQTLVGMAKKAKVARCSIEAARTLAFLCF